MATLATVDTTNEMAPGEWEARVDLAAAYRLVALYGWDDLIFTHISARVPGEPVPGRLDSAGAESTGPLTAGAGAGATAGSA